MSRELHKVVDILFAPYNYLIDPGNRKSLNIEWENSILIFDEAHNLVSFNSWFLIFFFIYFGFLLYDYSMNFIYVLWNTQESICAEAASFDLPSSLLTTCISEAQNCVDLAVARRDKSNDKTHNPDNFAILRGIICLLLMI